MNPDTMSIQSWLKTKSSCTNFTYKFLLWMILWFCRVVFSLNDLSHTLHENGITSEWNFLCFNNPLGHLNVLPHNSHEKRLPAKWPIMWSFKYLSFFNTFPQTSHEIGFSTCTVVLCNLSVNKIRFKRTEIRAGSLN